MPSALRIRVVVTIACLVVAAASSTSGLSTKGFEGRWKTKDAWVQWIIRPKAKTPDTFTWTYYPSGDPRGVKKWYDMSDLHRHGNQLTGYVHWKGPMNTRDIAMSCDFVLELRGSKLHAVSTITSVNNRLARSYVGRKNEYDFVRVK